VCLFQNFDRFRCSRLVMECMCQFDDASMNRMSVAICSILAAKVNGTCCWFLLVVCFFFSWSYSTLSFVSCFTVNVYVAELPRKCFNKPHRMGSSEQMREGNCSAASYWSHPLDSIDLYVTEVLLFTQMDNWYFLPLVGGGGNNLSWCFLFYFRNICCIWAVLLRSKLHQVFSLAGGRWKFSCSLLLCLIFVHGGAALVDVLVLIRPVSSSNLTVLFSQWLLLLL